MRGVPRERDAISCAASASISSSSSRAERRTTWVSSSAASSPTLPAAEEARLARALGHGLSAGVVQFVKGRSDTGEEAFFRRQPGVSWHVMGDGFTWDTQNRAADIASAQEGWAQARAFLRDPSVGIVILDELNIVLKYAYLDLAEVIADIQARPAHQHVVVTGRAAPDALIDVADTVTDMGATKHAFKAGIAAQPGVEF